MTVLPGDELLALRASEFADTLNETIRAAVGGSCAPFAVTALPEDRAAYIRQRPAEGIRLTTEAGRDLLVLRAAFKCRIGRKDGYFKTWESSFKVFPAAPARALPIVRYDFVEDPLGSVPAAHIQFHAEHAALTDALKNAGLATRKGRQRRADIQKGRAPQASDIHFPVGGRRFRPCLEDVLEVLMDEFGVRCPPGARDHLREARARWRTIQTWAVVRDAPAEAAKALREVGYDVRWPGLGDEPVGHSTRLDEL